MTQPIDLRPTPAAPDDDPYLWLEDIDAPAALAWVEAQNARTLARLEGPDNDRRRTGFQAILDRPDRIPHVTRRAGLLYNYWVDAANPRGLWRRTTLASFRTDAPDWDILLDLDALAEAEAEDWVWQGAHTLPPHHDRAILRLSRGGSDAVVLREFDLAARAFVTPGFTLPEAKGGIDWLDRDTLLLATSLGGVTTSGYARTIRLWARGTDPRAAPILFEVPETHMSAGGGYDRERDALYFVAQLGFFDAETSIGDRTGPKRRLDIPTDAVVQWDRGWLAIRPRTAWTVDGTTYPPDTVLGIGFDAFLAGDRSFAVLFTPTPRRAIQSVAWVAGRLLIAVLDDMECRTLLADPARTWFTAPIPGLPTLGTVTAWSPDADDIEADGTLLAMAQTPIDPPTLSWIAPGQAPAILKRAPSAFTAPAATVTRHEAISSDGERIPYIQVGPPTLTGDAPVFMTGYGGFGLSMLPAYSARSGKLWLERGGTTVTANLRGGGEFGTWWHEAGRRDRKHLSHDDFAAVARDLVHRGVTRPARIAAEGGSNGGLLIANMLTRYPERFGALFCTIPLIDMRRFHKLLAGASWIAEYGNPDEPRDWAFMQAFSAHHQAAPHQPYPPILIATTRRDDRVHPGHARKFAAKLQALGYDALFHEPGAGGHGYGKDNAEIAAFAALGTTFLADAIGFTADPV